MLNIKPIDLSNYNSDNLHALSFIIKNELELRTTYSNKTEIKPRIIGDRLLSLMLRDAKTKAVRDGYQTSF